MKNVINVIAFAFVLLATSCSKENLNIPQADEFQTTQNENFDYNGIDDSNSPQALIVEQAPMENITLRIQVEEVTSSQVSGELLVDFSCDDDLTGVVLEDTQYLDFDDGSGNTVTLTFTVNSFTGGVNSLDVAFAIGTNNLAGLTLLAAQEIVINDEIMN